MAEPSFGLSGLTSGDDGMDVDTAASNVAAMAFGLTENARAALGAHLREDQSEDGEGHHHHEGGSDDDDDAPRHNDVDELIKRLTALNQSPNGDATPNATALPCYDDNIVNLTIFEHSIAPLGCVVVMPSGVAGGRELAAKLCKEFVREHGVTYLRARETGLMKNYKKQFLPYFHDALHSLATQTLERFVSSVDSGTGYVAWSTAFYSPELTVAVESNRLTSEGVAEVLKAKRPPPKQKKTKKAKRDENEGATGIQIEPIDPKEEIESTFIVEALKRACVHTKAVYRDGHHPAEWSDAEEDEEATSDEKLLTRPGEDFALFKDRRELLAIATFLTRSASRLVPSTPHRERNLYHEILLPSIPPRGQGGSGATSGTWAEDEAANDEAHPATRIRIIVSGDFYLLLAVPDVTPTEGGAFTSSSGAGAATGHRAQVPQQLLSSSSVNTARGDDHLSNLKYHLKAVYRAVLRKD